MTIEEEGRRRRRGSQLHFSSAPATEAEGEVPLNERVRAGALPPSPLSEGEEHFGEENMTPQSRMEDVGKRASSYEREYRLKLVHRMLMRNVPLDQIAMELDISVATVQRDRQELYRRLKKEASNLDINLLVGDTLGFYREVQGMSLRAASLRKAPMNVRLSAMRTALAAKNDEHRFLNTAGIYDVLNYKPGSEGENSDLSKLMNLTRRLFSEDVEEQEIVPEEAEVFLL